MNSVGFTLEMFIASVAGGKLLTLTSDGNVPVRNLVEYFTSHDYLRVPPWQRDYEWDASDEGQVGDLLDDLSRHVLDSKSTEYLIGSVILCPDPELGGYLIIDGQQRTMTLSLFLIAAFKFINENIQIDQGNAVHIATLNRLNQCIDRNAGVVSQFAPRLAMNNTDADLVIRQVWSWREDPNRGADLTVNGNPRTRTERNILEVSDYIYRRLTSEEKLFGETNFLEAISKILTTIKLVEMTLDSRREALAVYDRINNRGLVLSSASLVKNQIFMKVVDSQFDDVSQSWLEMSRELTAIGQARLQDPKFLLRMLAFIKTGDKIIYDELVDFWGKEISEGGPSAGVEFAENLRVSAYKLKHIALKQIMREQTGVESKIEEHALYLPHVLNSVQHYAMLLAGEHLLSELSIKRLAQQVAHRAMLYVYAKERTGQFESIVPKWSKAISELPTNSPPEALDEVYRNFAFHSDSPVEVLRANLSTALSNWDYRNSSDRKKIRSVFALLELDLNPNGYTATELMRTRKRADERKGWDLDHIMPKSLSDEAYVHRIGNLTLLAPNENSGAGNALPLDKYEQNVYTQSNVYATKIVGNLAQLTNLQQAQINNVSQKRGFVLDYSLRQWGELEAEKRLKSIIKWVDTILIQQYMD